MQLKNNRTEALPEGQQRQKVDDVPFLSCQLDDASLIADGWERRFISDPQKAKEAAEIYAELGFEVRLEPVILTKLKEECRGCQVLLKNFRVVYTRKNR